MNIADSGAYDGEVAVGGLPQVRPAGALSIAKLAVGGMNNNAYLLRCTATGEALLVDAADEPERVLGLMRTGGPAAAQVLTTHRHADHWQALRAVVEATGARTLAGAPDADALPVAVDKPLEHGDLVRIGDVEVQIIALRGHTPGSVAVRYDEAGGRTHLFTGDSLFPGGVGRTPSPAAFTDLIDDVQARVFDVLDDHTWVYPGHGFDTTLGVERPQLSQWRARGW